VEYWAAAVRAAKRFRIVANCQEMGSGARLRAIAGRGKLLLMEQTASPDKDIGKCREMVTSPGPQRSFTARPERFRWRLGRGDRESRRWRELLRRQASSGAGRDRDSVEWKEFDFFKGVKRGACVPFRDDNICLEYC
jgi:hypothetical protein